MLCNWNTYKGSHCKKLISSGDKFCSVHQKLISEFRAYTGPESTEEENNDDLCNNFREIKIIPRSHRHVKSILESVDNDDDRVEVCFPGGSIEDASIENESYICMDSDNSRFYYDAKKGQKKAKDIKIFVKDYCKNKCIIRNGDKLMCKECFEKLKDVPRIYLVL